MGMVRFMVYADRHTSRPAQCVRPHGVYHGDLSRSGVHSRVASGAPSSIQTVLPTKAPLLVSISTPSLDESAVEVSGASNEERQSPQHIPEACVAYHDVPELGED